MTNNNRNHTDKFFKRVLEPENRRVLTIFFLMIGLCVIGLVAYYNRVELMTNPVSSLPIIGIFAGWYIGRPLVARWIHRRRHYQYDRKEIEAMLDEDQLPSVTVQLPAYNEAHNIEQVLNSIRRQKYGGDLEVIVVDDGSTDGTWDILQRISNKWDDLTVATKENEGLAPTRNHAFAMGTNEIVVSMDSDTILEKGGLIAIVREFMNDDVVGVATNVEVLNDKQSWWTRAQSIEYLISMEMARTFQSKFRHLMVISGGCGAYPRSLLEDLGGWGKSGPKHAEDFHMTISAHERGKIKFTPDAIALTEVPSTFRGWWKQRIQWAGGGLGTLLVNRRAWFNPNFSLLGLFALPLKLGLSALLLWSVGTTIAEFLSAPSVGGVLASVGYGYLTVLIATTGTAMVLLGIISTYVNHLDPLRKLTVLPLYLTIYRQVHVLVRVVAFVTVLMRFAYAIIYHRVHLPPEREEQDAQLEQEKI